MDPNNLHIVEVSLGQSREGRKMNKTTQLNGVLWLSYWLTDSATQYTGRLSEVIALPQVISLTQQQVSFGVQWVTHLGRRHDQETMRTFHPPPPACSHNSHIWGIPHASTDPGPAHNSGLVWTLKMSTARLSSTCIQFLLFSFDQKLHMFCF